MPTYFCAENGQAVYMGAEQVMIRLHEINETDWKRRPVMLGAKAVGKEVIKTRTKLLRRCDGPTYTPRQHGPLILGDNRVIWNPTFQAPNALPRLSTPVASAMLHAAINGPVTRITRPPNSWIIYRADKHKKVKKANRGASNNQICK